MTFLHQSPYLYFFAIFGLFVFIVVPLVAAMRVDHPPHAYNLSAWQLFDPTWSSKMIAADHRGYTSHVYLKTHFALQLIIAGTAGFMHSFCAWLVPFVAEEIGSQLNPLVLNRRKNNGFASLTREGVPYAFQPFRWIFYVDGIAHVKFSGGSYSNHGRFAYWASGQFVIGGVCGLIHALIPPLFPFVAEEVALELGGLIIKRRALRNSQEMFVNPANLSDLMFKKEWETRFEVATTKAASDGDIGNTADGSGELARSKLKVKLGAGQKAKFL
jgi:hypothetical protein